MAVWVETEVEGEDVERWMWGGEQVGGVGRILVCCARDWGEFLPEMVREGKWQDLTVLGGVDDSVVQNYIVVARDADS